MSTDASPVFRSDSSASNGELLGSEDRTIQSYQHNPNLYTPPSQNTDSSQLRTNSFPLANIQPTSLSNIQPLDQELPQAIKRQVQQTLTDQVTPLRLASHLSVLAVASIILILSQVKMPDWDLPLRALAVNALGDQGVGSNFSMQLKNPLNGQGGETTPGNTYLQQAPVFTVIQEKVVPEVAVKNIQTYIVQSGDTVLGIAQKFGLQPETIQWANSGLELNPDLIRPGDQLNVLPFDGALHIVTSGDTLSSIATKYRVSVENILSYPGNRLEQPDATLVTGSQLVLPGGTKPVVARQVVAWDGVVPRTAIKGTGAFVWPTSGAISQNFWSGHRALDIGAWTGAPVKAADSGYVAVATGGWNNGYGNYVIVDHGNGFVSLYAHLNSIYVRQGESVARGQQIGSVGNTGNSTGPHLHFEIRYQGGQRNPFSYLP